MSALFRQLHLAARSLSRVPALAAMAVLLPSLGAVVDDVDAPCPNRAGHHRAAAAAVVAAATTAPEATVSAAEVAAVTSSAAALPTTEFSIVTPEYFRATGVRLVRGRMFDADDRADGPPVVIVNEALARRYWPDEDAVGQFITLDAADANGPLEREVVGVVTNVRRAAEPGADVAPAVYLPLAQSPYPFL